MDLVSFVENYNTMPAEERKTGIAELARGKDISRLFAMAKKPDLARAATRVLADMGDRITEYVRANAPDTLRLLKSEDPKVRMHAAQIVGGTVAAEYLDELIWALRHEETMFVLPSMLLAVGNAKNARAKSFLEQYTLRSDLDKHMFEEKAALNKALANFVAKRKAHVRILPSDVILLSTPNANVTFAAFEKLDMKPKKFGAYVAVSGLSDFNDVYKTRAFETAYIYLGKCPVSELPGFLSKRESAILQRTGVTGYRLEVKSVPHEVRIDIVKKCIAACTQLINTPSSYSIEIMLDIQDAQAQVFLNPLVDKRFDYRKKSVAASIAPGVAACVVQYASEYFNPDARVLDNFCGSGTMLFERGYFPCHTLTGVDINIGAIEAAQENSRYAAVHPHFHHMDALKFTAKKYDEIISNMPFGHRVGSHAQNERLYKSYFHILPGILTPGGLATLYTQEKHLVERLVKQSGRFEILKRATFDAGGLYPAVYVLRKTD